MNGPRVAGENYGVAHGLDPLTIKFTHQVGSERTCRFAAVTDRPVIFLSTQGAFAHHEGGTAIVSEIELSAWRISNGPLHVNEGIVNMPT